MREHPAKTSAKTIFLENLFSKEILNHDLDILDMGSGGSGSWNQVFDTYPNLRYTGIEPFEKSLKKAVSRFGHLPNKNFYNQFAYEKIDGFGQFDVCLSLSVLEHVKQIEKMLKKSLESVKPGGRVVHWYDLGHALHPCSPKERFQVWIGNHLPFILPEKKFVCYLDYKKVKRILEKYGLENISISNHQFKMTRALLDQVNTDEEYHRVLDLSKWEYDNQDLVQRLPRTKRELLYPSIVIMGTKKK